MFDGIGRVQARISAIEQRLGLLSRAGTDAPPARALDTNTSGTSTGALFAAAFDSALVGSGTTVGASTARRGIGGFGAITPPAALVGYGNGRVPLEALEPIGVGQHRLWGPAAESFRLMAAHAAADGVTIGVTDSYRPFDEQVDLAERKGLYREGGLAAVPGTSSHGWGMAVDVDVDERGQQWLRDNAWRYGWAETTPREPWHWEFRPDS